MQSVSLRTVISWICSDPVIFQLNQTTLSRRIDKPVILIRAQGCYAYCWSEMEKRHGSGQEQIAGESVFHNPERRRSYTHYFFLNSSKFLARPKGIGNWLYGRLSTLNQWLLSTFGYELQKAVNGRVGLERANYLLDSALQEQRDMQLSERLLQWLDGLGMSSDLATIQGAIREFDLVFRQGPVAASKGGMGYNSGLVCFCFARVADPATVIESGVWRGFTTLLMDRATTTETTLQCFDLNLDLVTWRSPKAQYHECDLFSVDLPVGHRSLALFDDHYPHFERLQWCLEQGVDFVIVDDDVTPLTVHSDGWPPIPSAYMVMNYQRIPHRFRWMARGEAAEADISGLEVAGLQQAFRYCRMPNLSDLTGYHGQDATSFLVRRV